MKHGMLATGKLSTSCTLKIVVVPSPHNYKGSVGIKAHSEEMKAFIHAFPDHHINLPYKVTFGSGDWIVAVHENGGTFKNEWVFPNGHKIAPTGKKFQNDDGNHWKS